MPAWAQLPVSTFATGTQNSFTIRPDGTLWAWGYNDNGQLGDGTTTLRFAPVQIGTATNWRSISTCYTATLAIRTDGTLWAWGGNGYGQIGDGTTTQRTSPVQVGTATDWQSVSAGPSYTLATRTNGTLWAWGTSAGSTVPVQLGTGTWQSISAGGGTSLGVRSDGTLWAWSGVDVQAAPTQIGPDTNWRSVAASQTHYQAIRTDGTLWAWGNNGSGQLGDGTTTNRSSPVQIGTATTWRSVSVGAGSTLATRTDGTLWAWGFNIYGQLGIGSTLNQLTPKQVGTATTWAALSPGGSLHSLAARTDGSLWGWGLNTYTEAGTTDSSTVMNRRPRPVGGTATWQQVYAGDGYTLGLRQDGTLWAWGNNESGQLGIGATVPTSPPQQVAPGTTWKSVVVGEIRDGIRPNPIKLFVRAVRADGTLWAWGNNANNQFGTGAAGIFNSPVQIGTATTWVSVGTWLAQQQDGSLWVWKLNPNAVPATYTLTQVSGTVGMSWRSLAGSGAVRSDWTFWNVDWSSVPAPVLVQFGTDTNWQSVSVSNYGSSQLGIRTDGTLWAWGRNDYGQLGDGTTTERLAPVQIGTATNWRSTSAGNFHSTAVRTDGTLWTWGSLQYGQLGNGMVGTYLTPTQVGTDTNWQSASTGTMSHTMGIRAGGTLWGWGSNGSSELGYPNYFVSPRQRGQVLVTGTRTAAAGPALAFYPTLIRAGQALHYSLEGVAPAGTELTIYSTLGQRVARQQLTKGRSGTFGVGALPAGWYVARLRQPDGRTSTARFAVY